MTAPVGIYVRVSRKGDREDDRFHSPREQAERAQALTRAKGLEPGPVFEDIDVSGATHPTKRPAMGALLKAVKDGELGGIAAYSLDRLSREPAHGDELVRAVTKAGGVILTPDIPDAIDSPTGEFTFGMLLQVAKLYRSQAGARFATAKERAIRAGIPVGPPAFGYRRGADRRLEVDPETAPVVRELFERRVAGAAYTPLADYLSEQTGRTWSLAGVGSILRNRIYATGRLEYGPEDARIVSDVEAGAIVDEALWHAAQNVVARRPPRATGTATGWLLTGLLRCAACGGALSPWTNSRTRPRDPRRGNMERVGQKVHRRYRCRNRACTARANVHAERLERWVTLRSFAAGDELATRSEAPDLGRLEEAWATAERRLTQVLAPEARDALGDLWAPDVKARRTERDAALTRLGEARGAAGLAGAGELRLRDAWEGMGPVDRRDAIGLFWKVIRVARAEADGTHVTLVARGPQAEAEVALP